MTPATEPAATEPARRATVRVMLQCNNRCVFCASRGLAPSDEPSEDALARALEGAREGHAEVTFTGGEPTLHPALPSLVSRARALGFVGVGVQSNARRLAYPRYADALFEAGLTDLQTSLHGPDAGCHDYHAGEDGAFSQTLAGVARARARGLPVAVVTVVTRSNQRSLPSLPALLASRGVSAWRVVFPAVAGGADEGFDRVVPRVALAGPFVLGALTAARALGLPSDVSGFPLCPPGPWSALSAPSPRETHDARCEGCALAPRCPGLDLRYLARFGPGELVPASEVASPARPLPPSLARLFVGEGERAPRRTLPVEPPPDEARRALSLRALPPRAQGGRAEGG